MYTTYTLLHKNYNASICITLSTAAPVCVKYTARDES